MLSPIQVRALGRWERIVTPVCAVAAAVLAWVYLLRVERQMSAANDYRRAMAAMGMTVGQEWTFGDACLNFAMWVVMMVGMMAPSAWPVMMLFSTTRPAFRGKRRAALETTAFAGGYGFVWAGFSAAATAIQWLLRQGALLSESMAVSDAYLSGSIMLAAGLYQLTTWKSTCLLGCRSPLGFLLKHWRAGVRGAFGMGVRHGLLCVGCCWALMAVLFAVGVMNLLWVGVLTVLVLLEKVGPFGPAVARLGGAGLMALGAYTLARA